jgi:hypothetical protein
MASLEPGKNILNPTTVLYLDEDQMDSSKTNVLYDFGRQIGQTVGCIYVKMPIQTKCEVRSKGSSP